MGKLPTMDDKIRQEIEAILRNCIKVDASGLAPAVVGHHVTGFAEAADAILPLITTARKEAEQLRVENLNFQDRLNEHVGPITDEERLELIRFRVSYPGLLRHYGEVCQQIEELTGRDPRLPDRDAIPDQPTKDPQ